MPNPDAPTEAQENPLDGFAEEVKHTLDTRTPRDSIIVAGETEPGRRSRPITPFIDSEPDDQ